ncbi:unnamed protein product [Larinioides sclopetarius]|uniref:Uncharacterized protein n=1 Tax=Larinioides sclopetarius TaxID=280406 RepID=A0AAV1ZPK8_9ARAC
MAVPLRGGGPIRLRGRNQNEVPRGVLSLRNEAKPRVFQRRLWFGLIGWPGTGKQTLATRFNALHSDQLEVVVQNSYRFTIDLDTRPGVSHNGLVHVGIYIDPIPIPPGDIDVLQQIENLRALIFLFDVNWVQTLIATGYIFFLEREDVYENMSPSLLVGNKIDIRDGPRNRNEDELPPQPVSTTEGANFARWFGALEYYECSALRNTGVEPILDKILQLILR